MKGNYQIEQKCPVGSFAYTIKSGDTLFQLARRFNTTVEGIMAINPGIDPNNLQIGQVICIPGEAALPPCPNGFYYTIKAGDTLYNLSQKFNVPLQEIINANPGIDPNNLQIGQVICIPRVTVPLPPCPNGFYYTIKAGDTLYNLSQKFNVPLQEIINANPGIDPNRLQIGQVICIPQPQPIPYLPPCPEGVYYVVKAGDTLFSIGQKFNVSVQEIINVNPGIDPNRLQIGQILCIPRKCVVFCF